MIAQFARTVVVVGMAVGTGMYLLNPSQAEPRDEQWKKVEDAVKKGLPKTAIEHLEPIIESALKDKAYPEAIKAIARKIVLEANIQGNKPEEKITRMQAELAKAPAEMKPVMHAILGHWYWHYFQQNRWRILQRTATAEPPGEDFTTWDLPRLYAEIDSQFTAALQAEAELQKIPLSEYDALLVKGTAPAGYRPTLFDFLAYEAIGFYSSGEQAGARPQDAFVLGADSPIFNSAAEFVAWQVQTTDESSATVKAIRLYQKLLKFHADDEQPDARLDADLLRLQFGYDKAVGEEKNARYKAALQRFVDQQAKHPLSSKALFQWAGVLQQENDLVEAHKLARRGAAAFPDSIGGKLCHNLVQQIEARSVNLNVERVWNKPWPAIEVRYRNLTKAYFRIVKYDWNELVARGRWRPEYLDQNERKGLLSRPPHKAWSVDLPATDDFQERSQDVPAPEDLAPGYYFLISSHDEQFGDQNNQVKFVGFWVSDLALVIRSRYGEGQLSGFVLNALTGEPLAEAVVKNWHHDNNGKLVKGPEGKTDQNGLFTLQLPNQRSHMVYAEHGGQALSSYNDVYVYTQDTEPKPYTQTVFFTDRSLYRPGQTVAYKGLCISVNQRNDDYQTIPDRNVTVIFADPNGKEIERHRTKTNAYGSFSGSFTAPRDRVTGRMTIYVEGEPHGQTSVNVEEYKRPKFQVTLDAPKEQARLGGEVALTGKAAAYTGAAIGHASVRYRVVRQVRYPDWWFWRFWWRPPRGESQEIAHGTATTASDGTFEIKFTAVPDLTVPKTDEPTFQFTVSADVTDSSGETRSASRSINLGYTALKASMTADEWQTDQQPVKITLNTTTLDGEGQAAEGMVTVYQLKQPEKVQRADLRGVRPQPRGRGRPVIAPPEPDPSNPVTWELGDKAGEAKFQTDAGGKATLEFKLAAGPYRAKLETRDQFGEAVTAELPLTVLDPQAEKFAIKVPNHVAAARWTLEPGQDFAAVWGTGYDSGRAFIEIEHRRKMIQSYWTPAGRTQVAIKQAVEEGHRGGFTVHVTFVRENRAYLTSRRVDVPWTNKHLTLKWEHFTSKLQPGQKETWTLVVTGPDAEKAVAELAATLYDESLDAYLKHNWPHSFGVFRQEHSYFYHQFANALLWFDYLHGNWPLDQKDVAFSYPSFPSDITTNFWGYEYQRGGALFGFDGRANARRAAPGAPQAATAAQAGQQDRLAAGEDKSGSLAQPAEEAPGPDLSQVTARKNLNETAFFFPHLVSDKEGNVRIEFTMPEALTRWKFFGFAHDGRLRSGFLEDSVVTSKELMVEPNPPRFVREGDTLEFTVKVTNHSPTSQSGTVRLTFADARTATSADALLGNVTLDRAFELPAKESRSFSWKIQIPDGTGFLTYKAVGSTGRLSDGEEGYLPVLSRRVLVTESLPLPIRGQETRQFEFTRLIKSGESDTVRHQNLTVQMVSNPAWYAVLSLPYLMEYPYECTEQVFNRLYANALARHIANSDPKIRRIFDLWKGTPALDSPLEKNEDLRAVMLEETPWLCQAEKESQARRNVGILFDDNRLNTETARLLHKLSEQQRPDGAWPWFPGGPANEYITLYITTGFGRLRHLGVDVDVTSAIKSLTRLDAWMDRLYREILKHGKPDENHLSVTIALYLYGRSFFLEDQPIADEHRQAVDYFLGQARKYWLALAHRQSQAHLAVALKRFGDKETPADIMRSIKERSVSDAELGMFWRDLELSWWWFRAPIETQAMMIEAFDEVMNDAAAVEECKVWLLKQKQTQDWKTTKATADAVYALLLRGTDLLASDALVQVSLGDLTITPRDVEAGTGFYEERFVRREIEPQMGLVTVKKTDPGIAWGSVHWQYLEDVSKITPYEGTPLRLKKALFTREYTKAGPVLKPVSHALAVGDELVVRVELRVDRDMEYVHLKDQRGSGTEPVDVLSQYRYQDGLAYYQSTRDTASHFFIDYLPKGVYVFEYATRIVHKGRYQTGMAEIQCMYAPEFNSHSESYELAVE